MDASGGSPGKHHRVLRLDNRGLAEVVLHSEPYSLKAMASDCRATVEQAGVQDVARGGVSMGGMIAQEFALCYPERVRSLTLIATHPGGPKYLPRASHRPLLEGKHDPRQR